MKGIGMSTNTTNTITYSDLRNRYEKFLESSGKQSQIKNLKTIIKTWVHAFSLTESSLIGNELNGDFDIRLEYYVLAQEKRGIKLSTYRSRLSHLRAIKKFYESIAEPDNTSGKFHVTLLKLILTSGFKSLKDFHTRCLSGKCRLQRLRLWCAGRSSPTTDSLPLVEELERLLSVKAGTLTSLLPKRLRGTGKQRKTGQTSYGQKMMAAHKKPYQYWSPSLEAEWMGFVSFMTASYLPEGIKRNSAWTSSSSCKGDVFPSADIGKSRLRSFFGFCCLPKSDDPFLNGAGINPKEMTLSLLAEKRLVVNYPEFQKVRAGGVYTLGCLSFIELVGQLLRAETGYLSQYSDFSKKLLKPVPSAKWRKKCSDTRNRVISIGDQLKQQNLIVKGRDPEEPIAEILAQERPLHVLLQMIKDMQHDMPPENSSKRLQALHYRNILLVGLISSNPLRLRQFTIMEFDRHLKRRSDGEWWLDFKKREFKNRKVLQSDYSVRVERHLWPIIERYRNEFRPYLAGAKKCKYVFRQEIRRKGDENNIKPISRPGLTCLMLNLTRDYITISPGFCLHAFRHIVATDIIKKNPEFGFFLASKALHDKLETVERAYAHLKTHEYFEPVNRHFGTAWEEV